MSKHGKLLAATMAAAVAVAFAVAPNPVFANNNDLVRCPGVNGCQGKSDCRMTTATCSVISEKGQNACKGKGFLMLTKRACVKRGGRGVIYTAPANAINSQF
jgi:hypothetical protein